LTAEHFSDILKTIGGTTMNLHTKVVVVAIVVSSILTLGIEKILSLPTVLGSQKNDLRYFKEATLVTDCLYREGTPVSTKTIKETLETIDRLLPKYFPNGPYTREDFVAMAWLESGFNQYEIGTFGEKGIFQIMPDEFNDNSVKLNKYDIETNTQLCMTVLKAKWQKYPDYKKAVIAYNGVIRNKKGRWNEKYWQAFEKRRSVVEALFNS
jgi:transglycosylase-like protein with SLT domain